EWAVPGKETRKASVGGEIGVHDDFYSCNTKWMSDDGASVVAPADIDQQPSEEVQRLAVKAFQLLDCAGMARVDTFLTKTGEVIINEVNTLPGFTRISMYPKLWQASGLSYSDLITELIELAKARHQMDSSIKTSAF